MTNKGSKGVERNYTQKKGWKKYMVAGKSMVTEKT